MVIKFLTKGKEKVDSMAVVTCGLTLSRANIRALCSYQILTMNFLRN